MTDPIILQAKPSIIPVVAVWTSPLIIVGCPLLAFTYVFAKTLGFLAIILYLLAMFLVVVSIVRLIIDIVQLECTTYTLTENQIIKRYGFIAQRQKTLPRDRSQSEIQRPLEGRAFNYANLKVTSTGLGTITLQYLPNAQQWQEEIASQSTLKVNLADRIT